MNMLAPQMQPDFEVKEPYGDVRYADPGYREGTKRYPIDTIAHIRAAWAYINVMRNAAKYTADQLDQIKGRIKAAAERHGVQIAADSSHEGAGAMGMEVSDRSSLLAGVAPLAPPAAWFKEPTFEGPTKLTITEDGRVFGHLAQWRICHVGIGNSCVMAPRSQTSYSLFKVGSVICDDGSEVPVGKVVMSTAHANAAWGVMPSRDHYDNTALTAAIVNVGEDRHGIWVAGALSTEMSPEKVASLRASALSGDWRTYNGNLELIAALAVNSPGFPIFKGAPGSMFSMMGVGVVGLDEQESTEFSMSADQQEFVAPPTGVQDEEAEERKLRFAAIDASRKEQASAKRMEQLAVLDQQREALSESLPINDALDVRGQYDSTRFRMLPEDDEEEDLEDEEVDEEEDDDEE